MLTGSIWRLHFACRCSGKGAQLSRTCIFYAYDILLGRMYPLHASSTPLLFLVFFRVSFKLPFRITVGHVCLLHVSDSRVRTTIQLTRGFHMLMVTTGCTRCFRRVCFARRHTRRLHASVARAAVYFFVHRVKFNRPCRMGVVRVVAQHVCSRVRYTCPLHVSVTRVRYTCPLHASVARLR